MADHIVFRHPSGATSYTTERNAAEFAKLNPEWKRLTDGELAEMLRPGLLTLMKLLGEVEEKGAAGRDFEADWDRLATAMRMRL